MDYSEIKARDKEILERQKENGIKDKQFSEDVFADDQPHIKKNNLSASSNKKMKLKGKDKDGRNAKKIIAVLVICIVVFCFVTTVLVLEIIRAGNAKETDQLASQVQASAQPQNTQATAQQPTATPAATASPSATAVPTAKSGKGSKSEITDNIKSRILGKSYPKDGDAQISLSELSYLTIPYIDFNGNTKQGEMIVNAKLADEVLEIFSELYDAGYPIEKMNLVDEYGASDYTSIDNNNTSAFNYRVSTDGGNKISQHGFGRAIDINPQINPYVDSSGKGAHANAKEYWTRDPDNWSGTNAKKAFIGPGTTIYKIFVNEHGWTWGGSWTTYRDYQHFEKK